ncbi:hypothetical protein D104_02180 [Marinomonas profundimaris]|uniref:Lipoprotein n=2 Tax=Marinomonas profundimaris TaxID=1208321 RepID=W1RZF0_9GAMM|nr:hypothetical protein D104_02180 [Marinomonas profundimaris]
MKLITLLLVSFLLTACTSNPMGTISIRSVDQKGNLESPLVNSAELIDDKYTIFKTEEDGSTSGDDAYAIYLTDSYLKYLSDWWGINEVIFVVEFTEAVTGNRETDTTTKILGPYENMADGIKAPFFNKALYGPKKMESDLLTMNIKVYEYDLDESDQSSAMLEFIASAAESFSLSNPVTLGEIKVAKEIANTLLLANENDLVMNLDVDFVAGNADYVSSNHSNVLPLKSGQFIIVKQEGCSVGTCYDYFSNDWSNLPGLIPDFFMLIPTTLNRAFTDTPDRSSLKEFKDEGLKVTKAGLTTINKQGAPIGIYKDKTWLRLNIVKGGDTSQWTARKALYPSAEEIEALLKNPNSFETENLQNITQGLIKAQQSLVEAKAGITLTSLQSQKETHFIDQANPTSDLCIKYTNNIDIIQATFTSTDALAVDLSLLSDSKGASCYQLSPTATDDAKAFAKGSGSFIVNYGVNGKVKVKSIPVLANNKITNEDFASECTVFNGEGSKSYQLKLIDLNNKVEQVTNITLADTDTSFTINKNDISLGGMFSAAGSQTITIKGILGGTANLSKECIADT